MDVKLLKRGCVAAGLLTDKRGVWLSFRDGAYTLYANFDNESERAVAMSCVASLLVAKVRKKKKCLALKRALAYRQLDGVKTFEEQRIRAALEVLEGE